MFGPALKNSFATGKRYSWRVRRKTCSARWAAAMKSWRAWQRGRGNARSRTTVETGAPRNCLGIWKKRVRHARRRARLRRQHDRHHSRSGSGAADPAIGLLERAAAGGLALSRGNRAAEGGGGVSGGADDRGGRG